MDQDSIKAIYVRAVEQYFAENACTPLDKDTRQDALKQVATIAQDMMLVYSKKFSAYLSGDATFDFGGEIDKFQDDLMSIVKKCVNEVVGIYYDLEIFEKNWFEMLIGQTCKLIDEEVSQQERFCTFIAANHRPLVVGMCMEIFWRDDSKRQSAKLNVYSKIDKLLWDEANIAVFGNDFWFRIYKASHFALAFDFVKSTCRQYFVEYVDELVTRACEHVLAKCDGKVGYFQFDAVFLIAIELCKKLEHLRGIEEFEEAKQIVRQVFGEWMRDLETIEGGKQVVDAAQSLIFCDNFDLEQVEQIWDILHKYWAKKMISVEDRLALINSVFFRTIYFAHKKDSKILHEIFHVVSKKPCLRSCRF